MVIGKPLAPPAAFKASLDQDTGRGRNAAQRFAGILPGSELVGDIVVIVAQVPESEVSQQHPVNLFLALPQWSATVQIGRGAP